MTENLNAAMAIVIMAAVTLLLRVTPFIIFREKNTPKYIRFFGKFLPYAVMGMLVVYCLKDVSFVKSPFGIPEAIAVIVVAVLYIWRRNTLISIVSGTVLYMIMVQNF